MWLERLAASEPEFAADVEALLADHAASDAAQFLAGTAALLAGEPDPVASLAGQTLGNYTLERPLGQGGMGSVWLAAAATGASRARSRSSC